MFSATKIAQEKVQSSAENLKTFGICVESPLNCLSLNSAGSHVAVAGRKAFKIYSLYDEQLEEVHNLRIGRNINLNYSTLDVVWNQKDDNTLASAATNGTIVIWDLSKSCKAKFDRTYKVHKRTVNKLEFHPRELHYLLSGDQEGLIKLIDIRTDSPSPMIFNSKLAQGVRDVKFSPHSDNQFAAAFDSGCFQLWDRRNPSKPEKNIPSHNGPVFSVDYHPKENWIATAGRDRAIKVWDSFGNCLYTVQTISAVWHIKWRPNRIYHIASCAKVLDFSINIWDVQRPFIPFATFEKHVDEVTDIAFKQNNDLVILSCSKDEYVYQHVFKDARRPIERVNQVCIDFSANGKIVQAVSDDYLKMKRISISASSKFSNVFKRQPINLNDKECSLPHSTVQIFSNSTDMTSNNFAQCAKRYKTKGGNIDEMCLHNANVSEELKMYEVSKTWKMLQILYSSSYNLTLNLEQNDLNIGGMQEKILETKMIDSTTDKETSTGEDSDTDDQKATHLADIAAGLNQNADILYSDNTAMENLELNFNEISKNDLTLPTEAVKTRHELDIGLGTESLNSCKNSSPVKLSPSIDDNNADENFSHLDKRLFSISSFVENITNWKCNDYVVSTIEHYVELGDIQTAVCIMLVVGDKVNIEENRRGLWLMAYLDLLSQMQLYMEASQIMQSSNVEEVAVLNNMSTTYLTTCSKCGKHNTKNGWFCAKCISVVTCVVCHHPVKGLFVWCQGCAHGGHLEHLQNWFALGKQQCPAGCGHICEYI